MKLANNAHVPIAGSIDQARMHACSLKVGRMQPIQRHALAGFDQIHLLFYTRLPLGSDRSIYRLGAAGHNQARFHARHSRMNQLDRVAPSSSSRKS